MDKREEEIIVEERKKIANWLRTSSKVPLSYGDDPNGFSKIFGDDGDNCLDPDIDRERTAKAIEEGRYEE